MIMSIYDDMQSRRTFIFGWWLVSYGFIYIYICIYIYIYYGHFLTFSDFSFGRVIPFR